MGNDLHNDIELTARAKKELSDTFIWYEAQQKGLGSRFIGQVLTCLATIEQNPEFSPTKYKYYRERKVARFPYVIIYRFRQRKRSIRVFSVFHTSQNPKKKFR